MFCPDGLFAWFLVSQRPGHIYNGLFSPCKEERNIAFYETNPQGFPSKGLPKERISQQGNAENEWPFGNLLGEPRLSKSNSFAGTKYCQKTFAQRNVKQTKKTYLKTKKLTKKKVENVLIFAFFFPFNKQKFAQKREIWQVCLSRIPRF